MQSHIPTWNQMLENSSPGDVLTRAAELFDGHIALASSLGAEDQVLTHLLVRHAPSIPVFTLDTGRHFEETQQLLNDTMERYDLHIRVYFPNPEDVEAVVTEKGPNYFRNSIDDRKHCCNIRKVKPLRRALAGNKAWITGLRREQSNSRDQTQVVEWDEANQMVKFNPLWNWTEQQVWDFLRINDVPYNPLHDRNYPSIGCAPCTRAVEPGEDNRAGRWWWENDAHRECGIHIIDGRVVRATGVSV